MNNTYGGNTLVNTGTLELAKTGGAFAVSSGTVTIGIPNPVGAYSTALFGANAEVLFAGTNEIATAANININPLGDLEENGFSQTIGALNMVGGEINDNSVGCPNPGADADRDRDGIRRYREQLPPGDHPRAHHHRPQRADRRELWHVQRHRDSGQAGRPGRLPDVRHDRQRLLERRPRQNRHGPDGDRRSRALWLPRRRQHVHGQCQGGSRRSRGHHLDFAGRRRQNRNGFLGGVDCR